MFKQKNLDKEEIKDIINTFATLGGSAKIQKRIETDALDVLA